MYVCSGLGHFKNAIQARIFYIKSTFHINAILFALQWCKNIKDYSEIEWKEYKKKTNKIMYKDTLRQLFKLRHSTWHGDFFDVW